MDTLHEILVNKLRTLLSRAELRDLLDIDELLEHGACEAPTSTGSANSKKLWTSTQSVGSVTSWSSA
ncbi:MAG: hypothetical protein ACE5F1_22795 [Planctomycetota bacterium]